MGLFYALFFALPMLAQLTPDQKAFDFQALVGIYAKRYAGLDWKASTYGFDALNIAPWLDRINQTTNDLDFYDVMVEYVSNLRDGHDAYHLPSDFVASLGFTVDIYDGKVLIDNVNRAVLPQSQYPFLNGDELVSVDGVAVNDLLQQFAKYARQGNDRSTRRLASSRIVTRPQQLIASAVNLPDSASIVVRRANGAMESYPQIPWRKSGFPLTRIDPVPSPKNTVARNTVDKDPSEVLLRELGTSLSHEAYGVLGNGSITPVFALPQGFVRRLGSGSDYFYSGTYVANGLRIGYIRIPSYNPSDQSAALAQFQKEIAFFQTNTDGLVVDEMRNPGGLLCYGENIVANLMSQNFHPIGYQIRATYEYLQMYGERLSAAKSSGNQALIDQYQAGFDALQSAYDGSQRLTSTVPYCTGNFDRPPARDSNGTAIGYSKPMIMLIDEFSESTADSVPAMIQDNARGLLVGWRTNGMGGSNSQNIQRFQVGAYSEGDTGVTLSLMVRAAPIATDDFGMTAYIENVGVRPDVQIDYMTQDNLVNGGRTFVQAFTNVIVQQIQKGS